MVLEPRTLMVINAPPVSLHGAHMMLSYNALQRYNSNSLSLQARLTERDLSSQQPKPLFWYRLETNRESFFFVIFTIFTATLPPNADHSQNDENKPRAEYRNKDH